MACYAGVTIKAVRHYHQRGLLAEASRESSGLKARADGHRAWLSAEALVRLQGRRKQVCRLGWLDGGEVLPGSCRLERHGQLFELLEGASEQPVGVSHIPASSL
jgi:hypothetical protein